MSEMHAEATPRAAYEIAAALRSAGRAYAESQVTRAVWSVHMGRLWDVAEELGLAAAVRAIVVPPLATRRTR